MAEADDADLTGGPGQQRIAGRSPLYVWLPLLAFSFFCLDLIWEVVRGNVNPSMRDRWPFELTLLPPESAATLATAIGGLIFARAASSPEHIDRLWVSP